MFSRFRLLWIKSFIRFTLWKTWVSFLVFTFRLFSIFGCRIKCFNVFHFTVTALSIGFTPSLSACLEFFLGLLFSLLLAPSWFNYWWFVTNFSLSWGNLLWIYYICQGMFMVYRPCRLWENFVLRSTNNNHNFNNPIFNAPFLESFI